MLRMKALTDGTKKVRTETRKLPLAAAAAAAAAMAMAPNGGAGAGLSGTDLSRARVKARIGRVCSSDALMELSGVQLGGQGHQQQQPSSGAATNSGGTNGSPGSGTGAGSPWGGSQSQGQGPMQRIDEEGCGSADGAGGKQLQGSGPTGMSVDGAQAAMSLQHQLFLRRAHSSSMVEGQALASLMAARNSASQVTAHGSDAGGAVQQPQPQAQAGTPGSACAGLQAQAAGQQGASPVGQDSLADCVITDQDLAALGFDDLPQLSNPLSNGANVSARMDALSMFAPDKPWQTHRAAFACRLLRLAR